MIESNITETFHPSLGIASILAIFPFGADKFYVGVNNLGAIQLGATLSCGGLIFTIPWGFFNVIGLFILMCGASSNFLYMDGIDWAPVSLTDQILCSITFCFVMTFYSYTAWMLIGYKMKNCKSKKLYYQVLQENEIGNQIEMSENDSR
jgi:hypothetical protein